MPSPLGTRFVALGLEGDEVVDHHGSLHTDMARQTVRQLVS
jgi:hypothetical protein